MWLWRLNEEVGSMLQVLNMSVTEMLQQDNETSDVCIKTDKLVVGFFFSDKASKKTDLNHCPSKTII